jgi:hypothetical protein
MESTPLTEFKIKQAVDGRVLSSELSDSAGDTA